MGKPNIRWKKGEKQKLQNRIANYNQKIKRLAKKDYTRELIPKKLSFAEERDKIQTREQLESIHKIIDAFTTRGSETRGKKSNRGAFIPEFVQKQSREKIRVINKQRREQQRKYENLPVTDRNKKLGLVAKNFDGVELSHLRPRKANFNRMSRKELSIFLETLEKYDETLEQKNEKYKANFLKGLDTKLSPKQAKEIKSILDKIPAEKVVEKYFTDINMNIKFVYEPIEQQTKYEELLSSWKSVLDNLEE